MRIGICTGIENISRLEAMGFEYIELSAAGIAALEDEAFLNMKKIVDGSSIKVEAFNVFFPGHIKIVGPAADRKVIDGYIEKAVERASLLGGKVMVVGSGGPRNIPDGWDRDKAREQFAAVLRKIGDEAARYGIIAVIEPLNRSETNIINSVLEGLDMVRFVNHSNVKLLADFYHIRRESEDMTGIIEAGDLLKHLHIANSNGRVYPAVKDEDDYASFFSALKKIGYNERISIEAGFKDFDKDAKAALNLIRELSK